ncbi:hypothetical protein PSYJYH_000072 [Bacillus phage PSYJ-YH]|nr:hypothetical protein PSYJYH_000072 [Bacillus phage PSYJ-YH]
MTKEIRKSVKMTMSESNKVGFLKQSKEYAKGREYKTLQGKIKIINRFLENGEIMISFLNMKTDIIEIRTELDVNSMLYNYSRKLAQKAQGEEITEVKPYSEKVNGMSKLPSQRAIDEAKHINDRIKSMAHKISELERINKDLRNDRENMQEVIDRQFKLIEALMSQQKRG